MDGIFQIWIESFKATFTLIIRVVLQKKKIYKTFDIPDVNMPRTRKYHLPKYHSSTILFNRFISSILRKNYIIHSYTNALKNRYGSDSVNSIELTFTPQRILLQKIISSILHMKSILIYRGCEYL